MSVLPSVQSVNVVVARPSCDSPDYEVDFDGQILPTAVQVTIPCEDCPNDIAVDVVVNVQAATP